MTPIKWYECEIPEEEIVKGVLFRFQDEMMKALDIASWPEEAAVFASAWDMSGKVKIWLTNIATESADKVGFQWRRYYVRDLGEPPQKTKAALLLGHASAWSLLK